MKASADIWAKADKLAAEFLRFNQNSISPFHVVANVEAALRAHHFIRLEESARWEIKRGSSYYLVKGDSSLIAFRVPASFSSDQSGVKLVASHTDSPCLRLAPKFETESHGLAQAFVQCYGGGLWGTWLDRELLLGGRVALQTETETRIALFTAEGPVACIPNLAIHLRKEPQKNDINREVHLRPIIASLPFCEDGLRAQIAKQLGVADAKILDFDLCFADATPGQRFGLGKEFIAAARLDNLVSVFCSLEALVQEKAADETDLSLICMFDHEEIGSQTHLGAQSNFLRGVLERICSALEAQTDLQRILSRSLLLSCDMGHAVHPNHSGEHQTGHTPRINSGVMLKVNPNGRYTSDTISMAAVRRLAIQANVPLQEFIVGNESRCGSTVGPLLAASLCCHAADLGAPMLAMHSIRESMGVIDLLYYAELMKRFFAAPLSSFMPQR